MKLDDYWEKFQNVELTTKALDFKVLGLQVWPLLRTKIFYQIATGIGLFDPPHPNIKFTEESKPTRLPKAKEIVVPFSRKVQGRDPYSFWLAEHLDSPLLIEHHGSGGLDSFKPSFNSRYEEHVARAMRRLSRSNRAEYWKKIIAGFEKEFSVKIETYREYPKWFIRRSIVEALGFRSLFRETGAKKLYIVNAYSHPTVVLGAKLARIRVYEMQHGFISPYHPAYSYPPDKSIQSMPNVLLCWGEHWTENLSRPKNLRTRVVGSNPEFWDYLRRDHEKKSRIVVTSQGAIGQKLFAMAENIAVSAKDSEVVFRLHPNEDPKSYQSNLKNLTVSHQTPKFLDLISSAEFLVGGFSTTLFEGAALGCRIIVVDVPGIENIRSEIESGKFTLLKDRDSVSILNALAEAKQVSTDRYYAQLRPEALNA